VTHLSRRVHSGISPTRHHCFDLRGLKPEDPSEGFFNDLLDARVLGLFSPA
jgi:hypothetical protein